MAVKSNVWNNDCQLAREISIDDIGDYYTGTDVEEALQEIGVKDTSDDSRFDDIEADVAQNTSDISTNTGNISTNTGNIATNASDISDLQADKLDIAAPTVDAEVKTIKINDTTDDASTLGAGTIKYNTTDERFEGSDGSDWIPIGSGTGSFIDPGYNYANPDMEINIDGYNKYANTTAGDEPETGSGGTPVAITRAIESTTPLIGTQSLKISKSAANGQGEGVGYGAATGLFSLDYGFEYRESQIKFNYVTTANYVDGDMGLFIYDIDNTTLIKASVVDIPSSDGEPTEFFATWLPTGGTNYRLIWHVRTTSALAYDLTIDNIRIGAKQDIVGDVGRWEELTDFVSSGSQTVTYAVESGKYSIVLEFSTGIRTPSVIEIDDSFSICHAAWTTSASAYSLSYTPATGVWDTGNSNNWIYKIEKWVAAKNIKLATELTEYYANSGDTIDTDYDESYTVKGKMGTPLLANTAWTYYDIEIPNLQPDDDVDIEVRSVVDGTWMCIETAGVDSLAIPTLSTDRYITTDGNNWARGIVSTRPSAHVVRLRFSDVVRGFVSWGSTSGANYTWAQVIAASDGYDRWRLRKTSAGNPAEVPPLVRAEYSGATATVTSTPTIINYSTIDEDTHNAVTTGAAWQFEAPYPGIYTVDVSAGASVAGNSNTQLSVNLYKNGSNYKGIVVKAIIASIMGGQHAGSTTIRLEKGDTISMYISTGSSTGMNFSSGRISITRLGS